MAVGGALQSPTKISDGKTSVKEERKWIFHFVTLVRDSAERRGGEGVTGDGTDGSNGS